MPTADDIFRTELEKRGFPWSVTGDGRYKIDLEEGSVSANLDNVRRNYLRDGDQGAIIRFVDQIEEHRSFPLAPKWNEIRPFVRYSLEPEYADGFAGVLHEQVTEDLYKLYVCISPDGSRIHWILTSMLEDWNVRREVVVNVAESNMASLIAETRLEYEEVDGVKLGRLSTDETPFKASMILSPAFRELVSDTHGWPVLVVVPCRDFVYVISQHNHSFLGRLGRVVLREYENSGHPISADVLEASDAGIKAIGTFAPQDSQ